MTMLQRTQQLKSFFSYDRRTIITDRPLEIRPFHFLPRIKDPYTSFFQQTMPSSGFCPTTDHHVEENKHFSYTIFVPKGTHQTDRAILLLHGLNERNWDKYLTWAEHLSLSTGRAVILFPIAFHMNRTPSLWYNPRLISPWVELRKKKIANLCNSTFLNVALSSRLSESPLRFYISGRESIYNLWQLFSEIRNGEHPLFLPGSSVHIFAYSIGALLAQVFTLANPEGLASGSRLFMFCGGSVFNRMNGSAKDIMDQEAYEQIKKYYQSDFIHGDNQRVFAAYNEDFITRAFKAMIEPHEQNTFRKEQFQKARERIRVVTLKHDTVMPTVGVREAFGHPLAEEIVEEWDFPFPYSHQNPFPMNPTVIPEVVYPSFERVFCHAASFLG